MASQVKDLSHLPHLYNVVVTEAPKRRVLDHDNKKFVYFLPWCIGR